MMTRLMIGNARRLILLASMLTVAAPSVARAQVTQSIGFNVGYFALKGLDSRVAGDVLVADITDKDPLSILIKDFNGATFGGEWLIGFGQFVDAGVGVGFYQRTVPSIYLTQEFQGTGADIAQDLKLRVVPVTFSVRFLPMGRKGLVEPYVGAGVAALRWHYSEVGNFFDGNTGIYSGIFVANGTAVGPVVLGGLNFPVGDTWQFGGEARYQKADGNTGGRLNGFLGDRIDLGGWTGNFTVHVRF